ncbi:MAG TPA: (Fe-S)-binding protein, partial [Acidimicrobiia bacterium]|nr:(Fe-S)-binding protein [Acidimicrobiia bacterium]
APRRLLSALGCTVAEMPRNKDNTFCCGAGGGRIWMDDSNLTERPSENRIREAVSIGVDTFVVACPKDMTMYTDAAKTTGNEETMAVLDVVQLLDDALDRDALAARHPAAPPAPEPAPTPAEPAAEAAPAASAVAVLERPEPAPDDAPTGAVPAETEITVDLPEPVEAAAETEAPPEG